MGFRKQPKWKQLLVQKADKGDKKYRKEQEEKSP